MSLPSTYWIPDIKTTSIGSYTYTIQNTPKFLQFKPGDLVWLSQLFPSSCRGLAEFVRLSAYTLSACVIQILNAGPRHGQLEEVYWSYLKPIAERDLSP